MHGSLPIHSSEHVIEASTHVAMMARKLLAIIARQTGEVNPLCVRPDRLNGKKSCDMLCVVVVD